MEIKVLSEDVQGVLDDLTKENVQLRLQLSAVSRTVSELLVQQEPIDLTDESVKEVIDA